MGNAPSGQRAPSIQARPRDSSTSPSGTSPHPHPSLRTKKKSLELPDLASLSLSSTRGRQPPPPKSASIPIPVGPGTPINIPGETGRTRAPITLPSTTDVQLIDHHRDHNRDAQAQRSRYRRIQDMYDEAQAPAVPPPRMAFVPETVTSTLPAGLVQAVHQSGESPPELVPIKISWKGGGKSIFLARAGDDDWKGRLAMIQESPGSNIYNATVNLPPGTHHIRFLIDDLWRVADHLPTAVDDQGSLANYVAVAITYSPPNASAIPQSTPLPSSPPIARKLPPGTSFWSAASSTSDDDPNAVQEPTHLQPTSPPSNAHAHAHGHHISPSQQHATWTSELPPELIAAAHEEEAYLAASEGQVTGTGTGPHSHTQRVMGFVPAPNIPPAPGLPRHLDKLILNARAVGPAVGAPSGKGKGKEGERDRDREKSGAKGRDGGRDRERRDQWRDRDHRDRERERDRDDRDRRRDRERDRERRPPPPPPPSEAGTLDTESDVPSAGLTPTAQSPSSPLTSADSTPPSGLIPAPQGALAPQPIALALAPPLLPASRPLTLSLDNDTATAPTDDGSVLPVPSHAVLHHLSTSAIRNGVLAVGNTTRYRKKYLTTIYYKPTDTM